MKAFIETLEFLLDSTKLNDRYVALQNYSIASVITQNLKDAINEFEFDMKDYFLANVVSFIINFRFAMFPCESDSKSPEFWLGQAKNDIVKMWMCLNDLPD